MAKAQATPLNIVCDTREQLPYDFTRFGAAVHRVGLTTGDYSLVGYENRIALERKTLDDLIGCLTTGRARFERELVRAKELDLFTVVVEANMEDVFRHRYKSRMAPHAALQSILALQIRYGLPFVWASSRKGGEYCAFWTLSKWLREKEKNTLDTGQSSVALEDYGSQLGKVG